MMIRGTRPHNSGLRFFFIFIGLDFRICEEKAVNSIFTGTFAGTPVEEDRY